MKTINIIMPVWINRHFGAALGFLAAILLLWFMLPAILNIADVTAGLVDAAVWQLLLFSIISYLSYLLLISLLLTWLLRLLRLEFRNNFYSQFKTLTLWQQLRLYWASFALLLLAGIACLAAVF